MSYRHIRKVIIALPNRCQYRVCGITDTGLVPRSAQTQRRSVTMCVETAGEATGSARQFKRVTKETAYTDTVCSTELMVVETWGERGSLHGKVQRDDIAFQERRWLGPRICIDS